MFARKERESRHDTYQFNHTSAFKELFRLRLGQLANKIFELKSPNKPTIIIVGSGKDKKKLI